MFPVLVDPARIMRIIDSVKVSLSTGTDGIHSEYLKGTKIYSSMIFYKLFQQSLDLSNLPDDWKMGKMDPLHLLLRWLVFTPSFQGLHSIAIISLVLCLLL